MSLGNLTLSSLKPKKSETAAVLLTVPKTNTKKETTLQIRISEDKRLLFKEICEECTGKKNSMSEVLCNYIDTVITRGTL